MSTWAQASDGNVVSSAQPPPHLPSGTHSLAAEAELGKGKGNKTTSGDSKCGCILPKLGGECGWRTDWDGEKRQLGQMDPAEKEAA